METLANIAGKVYKGHCNIMEVLATNNAFVIMKYPVTAGVIPIDIHCMIIGYDKESGYIVVKRDNGTVELINLAHVSAIVPEGSARSLFE